MIAYRRVYDSRHLQADCQEPGSVQEPTLGNRVWATFFSVNNREQDVSGHYRKLSVLAKVL